MHLLPISAAAHHSSATATSTKMATFVGLGFHREDQNDKQEQTEIENKSDQMQKLTYEEKLANARAIALRFANSNSSVSCAQGQEHQQISYSTIQKGGVPQSHTTANPLHYESFVSLGQFEYKSAIEVPWYKSKLHRALLKNWEYLARKDEEALHMQIQAISKTSSQIKRHDMQQDRSHEDRRQALDRAFGRSGIGSGERRNNVGAENKRKRHTPSNGCSVYVKGFPANSQLSEKYVREIFSPWGEIDGVKLYKASAIIAYKSFENADNVVSQFNGATLQCGSVISVEAAYKNKSRDKNKSWGEEENETGSPKSDICKPENCISEDGQQQQSHAEEKETELDDFFASL